MEDNKNKGGRPPLTLEAKTEKIRMMSQKLEPYLKSGLSIRCALGEAKISKDSFYRMMNDEGFRDTINRFRNFIPVLLNNLIVNELLLISAKQNPPEGKQKQELTKEDKDFLWKFAVSSNLTKNEFGRKTPINTVDPEAEIQRVKRIIDESTTEEIYHIQY